MNWLGSGVVVVVDFLFMLDFVSIISTYNGVKNPLFSSFFQLSFSNSFLTMCVCVWRVKISFYFIAICFRLNK